MTISVGFLEIGELGSDLEISLLKTMLITGSALFFMALVGFNTAFAPTINGVIGNPLYTGLFLGGSSTNVSGLLTGAWWSQQSTGLSIGTYFLFETAFASVTLALVGVIVLRKMKMQAFFVYSIVYFIIIWNLPCFQQSSHGGCTLDLPRRSLCFPLSDVLQISDDEGDAEPHLCRERGLGGPHRHNATCRIR